MPKKTARKKLKAKNRKPNKAGLGLAVLAFLILLVVVGKLLGWVGELVKGTSTSWDGKTPINLVVKADNIYLLSFSPADKEVTGLKIPPETNLKVPFDFGNWPIRSIYGLGGDKLLKATINTSFGLPVSGFLAPGGNFKEAPLDKIVGEMKGNPIKTLGLFSKSKTDLSVVTYLKLWWGMRKVRTDKVKVIDLADSNLISKMVLPDGTAAQSLDQKRLDQFIQKQLADTNITSEALSIGIYNTTEHPGLAEQAARLITNMGGRVVFTLSTTEHLKESVILGKPSYTMNLLPRVFQIKCGKKCQTKNSTEDLSQAEINLFLGEDYFMRYNTK
ncbi:LytR C-terminal domain-containing protein [Candidatus Daviesbacteria bacterium]|nr:LytR C-terminal domain-containing protein [Candidatus Daviesbacteria bacterium]